MKIKYPPANRAENQAERQILKRILSGEYAEGIRLPNTTELAAQLKLGANSVQQALARLSAQGYLERKPRLGTIVRRREATPANVIVLVGPDLKREPHYMDRRLTACLEMELNAAGYHPHIHDNLIAALEPSSPLRKEKVKKMIRDFTMYDPVGVIESTITLKRYQELSSHFEIPSVSIKAPTYGGDVNSDHGSLIRQSIQHLAASGRKRLLWILKVPGRAQDSHRLDGFWESLRATKLECGQIMEIDDQDTSRNPEEAVCERMKAFLRENRALPPAKRVDCVLVDEDILMRGVSVALLSEQVQIPQELLLVTHTNENIDLHYGVPVIRYENPISEIAREAVKLLTARIQRAPEPPLPILVSGRILDPVSPPPSFAGSPS